MVLREKERERWEEKKTSGRMREKPPSPSSPSFPKDNPPSSDKNNEVENEKLRKCNDFKLLFDCKHTQNVLNKEGETITPCKDKKERERREEQGNFVLLFSNPVKAVVDRLR